VATALYALVPVFIKLIYTLIIYILFLLRRSFRRWHDDLGGNNRERDRRSGQRGATCRREFRQCRPRCLIGPWKCCRYQKESVSCVCIVESVDNIAAIAAQTGLDSTYPFPRERISLQTPPGVSGNVDVSITAPSGSTTAARSFQYLASPQSYLKPGFFRYIQYGSKRQKLTIGGKSTTATFVDTNTVTATSPALPAGAQQVVLTNTGGETISLDAALTAN
jgi:hypothetical protein